jgi:hypothetical protein
LVLHVSGVKKTLKKKAIMPINAVEKWQWPNGNFVETGRYESSSEVRKTERRHHHIVSK